MPRDYLEVRLRFFDHYLKGRDSWDDPTVQHFRMGTSEGSRKRNGRLLHGGEWDRAEEWPLPDTKVTTYYAHGDGGLRPDRPEASEAATTYDFDPRGPVPTLGGNCSSYYTFEPREESIEEYPLADRRGLSITGRGGYDQRTHEDTFGADPPYGPLEERDDVLTFRTAPLEDSVEIAGPIQVSVFASTDAPDTDFTAKLIDEYPPSEEFPDGFALNLYDSICRARYRGYRREPDYIDPSEVYKFEMEPYPTANVFGEGHRIRLDVSSSNYLRYDINHNTGGPLYGDRRYEIATNTVYHDREHPTHVELPLQSR
jgi:predicted acyl esterase